MAVMNLPSNALYGENGTGKLYIASNYAGTVYADGNGTNEAAAIAALNALTWADVGYFENFAVSFRNGDTRVIETDYQDVGEIMRKAEQVFGFSADIQEILEMTNFAKIFDATVSTATAGHEIIGKKRVMKNQSYHAFKFVTAPDVNGDTKTFFFVKTTLSGDTNMPMTNLNRNDFVGVSLTFEVAEGGNFYIDKVL